LNIERCKQRKEKANHEIKIKLLLEAEAGDRNANFENHSCLKLSLFTNKFEFFTFPNSCYFLHDRFIQRKMSNKIKKRDKTYLNVY
jgi:hypothetical protein